MKTHTESQDIFDLDVRDVVIPDEEASASPTVGFAFTGSQKCTGECCTFITCPNC